jgi:hypothetical protein
MLMKSLRLLDSTPLRAMKNTVCR